MVFTHLHPDHVGWNLTNGQPTFPRARYLVPRKDWDYWTQPSVLAGAEHITNQVLPLNDLKIMDWIGGDPLREEWGEFIEALKNSDGPGRVDTIEIELKPPLPEYEYPIWMQGISGHGTTRTQVQ